MRRTPTLRRGGFTLVELLVAAALSLVVMTILAYAFQTGMATLSQLKSVIGMAEQLRAAENVMKRDLFAYHLEADQARLQRVSEMDGTHRKGYLSFTQGGVVEVTPGSFQGYGPYSEGGITSADSPQSFRTPSAPGASGTPARQGRAWMDHVEFTVRLAGDKPQETFTAPAVGTGGLLGRLQAIDPVGLPIETRAADPTSTQLTSAWAEVAYLLLPSGPNGGTTTTVFSSDEGGVTQLPLYTLYRRQRVLADRTITSPTTGPNQFGLSDAQLARGIGFAQSGGIFSLLGPEGVVGGNNRIGGSGDPLAPTFPNTLPATFQQDLLRRSYPIPVNAPEYGSDVLLNNVISMTVRPVYEFDVSPTVLSQLQAIIASGAVSLTPGQANTLVPVPKSLQTSTYNTANGPSDWLELAPLPGAPGARVPANATSASGFPRFYDTAGPSKLAVVFRRGTGASAKVLTPKPDWDPNGGELSVKMKAIEIKLRVYDAKNKTSRQLTLLQDL